MKRASMSLLTICGLEELESHRSSGVSHVLSILDPGTPDPEGFGAWDRHHRTTLRFHDIIDPMDGMLLPTRDDVQTVVEFGEEMVEEAEDGREGHLLIHCHMGISRSTAAMTIMLATAYPDESGDALMERLTALRPQAWPNILMIGFADDVLRRGGDLSAAATRLHARQIESKPHLADTFRRLGRAREVELASAVRAVA